jgi:hypothetical protein
MSYKVAGKFDPGLFVLVAWREMGFGEKIVGRNDQQTYGQIWADMGVDQDSKLKERVILTGSDNGSTTNAGLSTSSAQCQHVSQPAESNLLAATIKVGGQSGGSSPCGQLAGIRRVTNRQDGLQPARAGGDRATVHPDVEAGAAAVCAIATLANATEGQSRDVKGGIINSNATGAGA